MGILLGAHMSIAGGVFRAVERAMSVESTALQIFTKNSNQWKARPLDEEEIHRYKELLGQSDVQVVIAHDSYLLNLGSPEQALWSKSVEALVDELERCRLLDVSGLVVHPGAHMGSGEEEGLRRIAEGIDCAFERTDGSPVKVLLETTAGQGSALGYRFEHLAEIRSRVRIADRLGVCVDTCHLYAAGYGIHTEEGYDETVAEFERIIGLECLEAIHLNDSKKGFGSRVDRHEHIGKGCIGVETFGRVMNDARLAAVPKLLETPKGPDLAEDRENLSILRGLIAQAVMA